MSLTRRRPLSSGASAFERLAVRSHGRDPGRARRGGKARCGGGTAGPTVFEFAADAQNTLASSTLLVNETWGVAARAAADVTVGSDRRRA